MIEVRPVTSPAMDMQPSGSNNMLSFNLPNNEDYFLLSDSVYLSGLIQVDITSTDAEDTYANVETGHSENIYHSPEPSIQSRWPGGG